MQIVINVIKELIQLYNSPCSELQFVSWVEVILSVWLGLLLQTFSWWSLCGLP